MKKAVTLFLLFGLSSGAVWVTAAVARTLEYSRGLLPVSVPSETLLLYQWFTLPVSLMVTSRFLSAFTWLLPAVKWGSISL